MFVLEGFTNDNTGEVHYLSCGESLKISRSSSSHIPIAGDKSISRDHASLFLLHSFENMKNNYRLPEVVLKDHNSKYHTFLNDGIMRNEHILPGESITLTGGDRIRFGVFNNIWTLVHRPLVVTSSQIKEQNEIKSTLLYLGGHFVNSWNENCNYLVMNGLMLTTKTVNALIYGAHIVTPDFFTLFEHAVRNKLQIPNADDHLPPLMEMSIGQDGVSFKPDIRRKDLYNGLNFIFTSEAALNRMKLIVESAGGSTIVLTSENATLVIEKGNIFINQQAGSIQSKLVIQTLDLLKENRLSSIPETDIGLGILYVNVEKYCNPNFNTSTILKRTRSKMSNKPLLVFATETQHEFTEPISIPSRGVVPETIRPSGVSTRAPLTISSVVPSTVSDDKISDSYDSNASTCIMNKTVDNAQKDLDIDMEKENYVKKRSRTSSSDKDLSPLYKRNKSQPVQEDADLFDVSVVEQETESMDSQNTIEFDPKIHSTMRDEDAVVPKIGSVLKEQRCNEVKENDNIATNSCFKVPETVTPTKSALKRSKLSRSPKFKCLSPKSDKSFRAPESIPFDPYTLPTPNIDNIPSRVNNPLLNSTSVDTGLPILSPLNDRTRQNKEQKVVEVPVIKEEVCSLSFDDENDPNETKWLVRKNPTLQEVEVRKKNIQEETQRWEELRVEECDEDLDEMNAFPEVQNANAKNNRFTLPSSSRRRKNVIMETPDDIDIPVPKKIKRSLSSIEDFPGDADALVVQNNVIKKELKHEKNEKPFVSPKKRNSKIDLSELEVQLSGCMIVQFVNLVKRTPVDSTIMSDVTNNSTGGGSSVNYKRFKKVYPLNLSCSTIASNMTLNVNRTENFALPRIIGGSDLVVYSKDNPRLDDFLDANREDLDNEDERRRDFEEEDRQPEETEFNLPTRKRKVKNR